jgi:hypothetical protein
MVSTEQPVNPILNKLNHFTQHFSKIQLILSYHLRISPCYPAKILYAFLISSMRDACFEHLIHLDMRLYSKTREEPDIAYVTYLSTSTFSFCVRSVLILFTSGRLFRFRMKDKTSMYERQR